MSSNLTSSKRNGLRTRKPLKERLLGKTGMTYHLNLLSGLPEGAPQASIIMIMMPEDTIQTISKKPQGFVLESLRQQSAVNTWKLCLWFLLELMIFVSKGTKANPMCPLCEWMPSQHMCTPPSCLKYLKTKTTQCADLPPYALINELMLPLCVSLYINVYMYIYTFIYT